MTTPKTAGFQLPWKPKDLSKPENRRQDDREQLYHAWKAEPTTDNLMKVVSAYDPEINRRVRSLKAGHVPPGAMKRFAKVKAIRAIKSWDSEDPGGKGLAGWVSLSISNITGDLDRYKSDTVRLRGKRAALVGRVLDAQSSLTDILGREPTIEELTAEVGESPTVTARVVQQTIDELHAGNMGFTTEMDPFGSMQQTPLQVQIMRGVRMDLTPDEQLVWDYLLGINGKQKITKLSDIATKIGRANSFVSRARQKISRLVREAGGEAF